jgi:hypothetical protein
MMVDHGSRHHLFGRALRRADWTARELWLAVISRGGTVSVLDLDAFLHGLNSLPPDQQDVLALALNERLTDLYESVKVPYLAAPGAAGSPAENPLAVLEEHLRAARGTDHPPPRPPA